MFEDYYYGDDIFRNQNSSAKPGPAEKKPKEQKAKKPCKVLKKNDSKTGKLAASSKEKVGNKQAKKVVNSANTDESHKSPRNGSLAWNISHQSSDEQQNEGAKVAKKMSLTQNAKGILIPVKPVPQRLNGSNFSLLLNACKINSSIKAPKAAVDDENLNKRDLKTHNKLLQEILSSNESIIAQKSSQGMMNSVQETLAALLNLNKSQISSMGNPLDLPQSHLNERRSSSEFEENLKQKTPSKSKPKRQKFENNDTVEKRSKDANVSSKKHRPFGSKRSLKIERRAYNEDNRVSRCKECVRIGTIK